MSVGERILKIDQHLAKLAVKYSGTFFRTRCIHRESKKQYTWLLIITSANVDRFSKYFHRQIHGLPPHLNCVATLPSKIQKSEIAAERLLILSKLNFSAYCSIMCNHDVIRKNRQYITYRIVVRGGPSQGHSLTGTKNSWKFALWFSRYARKQSEI